MQGQRGFWDVEDRLKELSAEGDPLEKLSATVDFEMFRPLLEKAIRRGGTSKGGRPGFDVVLKCRMLVLQALHGLSLQQTDHGKSPAQRSHRAAHAQPCGVARTMLHGHSETRQKQCRVLCRLASADEAQGAVCISAAMKSSGCFLCRGVVKLVLHIAFIDIGAGGEGTQRGARNFAPARLG